jgi:4-hydroxybenzoate polyprenyltransferase
VRPGDHLLAWWRLSRPEVWMASVFPFYVGYVLASRDLVPAPAALGAGLDALVEGRPADAVAEAGHWLARSWRLLLGAVVLGPLLWTATLLVNDVHDLPGDRLNPRKARSPLVRGVVSRPWAHRAAHLFAAASLAAAMAVGWAFAVCVLANLALAWAYSVPPLRLKTRPGADVLVNAVGIGAVSAMAGWTVVSGFADAPWAFLPQGLLVAAAIYVPTTLVDHTADKEAGYLTLATHLGPRRAYLVGWWCWVACNAGALALAALDLVIPRAMLPVLVIFVPILLYEYHAFIGKARDPPALVQGILLCSLTFLGVNLVFALLYTGLWSP